MEDVKVGNSQYIRNLNLTAIFRLIHKYGPVSRKRLAENTGYSAATISNHVKRLIDSNFVIEIDKGSSTGGRKPVYLTVNPDRGYILSLDIEVNYIRFFIFDLSLTVKKQIEIPMLEKKAEELLPSLVSRIKIFCQDLNIDTDRIIGLGITLPGLVNNNNGILHFAPNLKWKDIDVKKYFQEAFNFSIIIENEAKAAVLGERELIYPGVDNMVFVSINEGIGCGIILNGGLYRGASGNAGEFGHIIIDGDGPKCHCGNYGCWETLASINFIINKYFKETNEYITGSKLRGEILDDNEKLLSIVKESAENIATGLVNIINSLSPEVLIIGGDIINIKGEIVEDIDTIIAKKTLAVSYEKVSLAYSKLGNEAALFGMARMVFDNSIEEEITRRII